MARFPFENFEDEARWLEEHKVGELKATFTPPTFKVRHFTYNGFGGQLGEGYAAYTATFLKWTVDPGVAMFTCSDGQERLIPTFALEGEGTLPEQPKTGVMFGQPSRS